LNLKIYFALAEEDAAALPSLGRIGVVVVLEPWPVKNKIPSREFENGREK
jgi:hypothetical protein